MIVLNIAIYNWKVNKATIHRFTKTLMILENKLEVFIKIIARMSRWIRSIMQYKRIVIKGK